MYDEFDFVNSMHITEGKFSCPSFKVTLTSFKFLITVGENFISVFLPLSMLSEYNNAIQIPNIGSQIERN